MYFFFFNDTATTEIYTLSLHGALPICPSISASKRSGVPAEPWRPSISASKRSGVPAEPWRPSISASKRSGVPAEPWRPSISASKRSGVPAEPWQDRKSTRLNSSHSQISYAVFCLKKKKPRIHRLPLSSLDFRLELSIDSEPAVLSTIVPSRHTVVALHTLRDSTLLVANLATALFA